MDQVEQLVDFSCVFEVGTERLTLSDCLNHVLVRTSNIPWRSAGEPVGCMRSVGQYELLECIGSSRSGECDRRDLGKARCRGDNGAFGPVDLQPPAAPEVASRRAGYRLSADPKAVLRHYYDIPEDRLQSSVTYEKHLNSGTDQDGEAHHQ